MRGAGVDQRVDFRLADSYATPFSDDSFDIVIGASILHHLKLDRALAEIRRVPRPGGCGVFIEPLAHNPLMRLGRLLTRSARTDAGRPFTEQDWALCAHHFHDFRPHRARAFDRPADATEPAASRRRSGAARTTCVEARRAPDGALSRPAEVRPDHVPAAQVA